ncbi:unnamed protein product [Schistosoma margrebowiei]|uniref:6-phosphofructo-2-kinase domain-containing protein n=3 Tax=Schistosoma TaxID=6181 RepID=A0AA84Z5J1_9TREM|nr:unnamed protein product [Schistosoma margrebowiei]
MYSDRRVSLDIAPLASWDSCSDDEKTVVVLVGLPARGKSYISTKLSRYLNWVGINTRVFNVGAYRRLQMKDYNDHSYFSDENNEGVALRQKIASEALDDLISWLTSDVGRIAVFDATNTTRERRLWIMERCKTHNFQVIFVESICKDKNLIQENVLEVKVNSPDYKSIDKEEALKDFLKRIEHYEKRYESIDDDLDKDWSYIKIFDQGKRYLANRIEGNINSRIVYYLMNIRVNKRTIYLTRWYYKYKRYFPLLLPEPSSFLSNMIIPIHGPNGEVSEWLMIELQGDVLSKTNSPLAGKNLGDLHFSQENGDPVLLIGHHVLFGKVVALEKPMLVTKRNTTSGSLQYDIVSVIRRKLLFKTRPKPIISCASKKV